MNRKVYVNGGIIIETPNFRYLNAGARYDVPPENAEIIEPDGEINGEPCLIITDKKAPTFFKEYYAKTFFSTKYSIAPFFSHSIEECLNDFNRRISDVINLLHKNDTSEDTRQILYRLSLVSAVSAFDTYICDLVLFIATKDKEVFLKTAEKFCGNKAANIISRIAKMWSDNILDSAELEVIDCVLKTSYSNQRIIKDNVLQDLYKVETSVNLNIQEIFHLRHIIAHRSGRQKDGNEIEVSNSELLKLIDRLKDTASTINEIIKNTEIVKRMKISSHDKDME
ncbi:MAG: hypothetical protein K2K64_11570 [Muribaculaceae bacterium]|nr:hypothetical protein [Muribaculaceae bacterium]